MDSDEAPTVDEADTGWGGGMAGGGWEAVGGLPLTALGWRIGEGVCEPLWAEEMGGCELPRWLLGRWGGMLVG